MKRVSCTAEFKTEAVKQVIERSHSVVEVSHGMGKEKWVTSFLT